MEVTGFPEKESNLCFIFHRLTQVSQGTTISVQDEGNFFSFFTGQILQKKYLDLKDAKINNLPCIIHQDFWYNLKRNYNRLSFKKKKSVSCVTMLGSGVIKEMTPPLKVKWSPPYTHGRYSHSGGLICIYLIQIEIFVLIVA